MQLTVLVEPIAPSGFRARGPDSFGFVAEGATQEEALQKLRELIQSRMAGGAQLVQLDVPAVHPWERFVGMWKPDDPLIEEWKKAVEEYRREVDEDPDYS
jgi:hypothetical protein